MAISKRKTKPDPLRMFLQAHAFFQAQELLYRYGKDDDRAMHALAIPAVTLSAFASELFLKCLLCIETGTTRQGHNLRKLFDALSSQSRERLIALWDNYVLGRASQWDQAEHKLGRKVARDLPAALSAGHQAFELLRYRYEGAAPPDFQFYLDDLPHMLGCVILELKPEWKVSAAEVTVVPSSNE